MTASQAESAATPPVEAGMSNETTMTDPKCGAAWQLDDQVTRLREWGTSRVYELPTEPAGDWLIGSAAASDLRLRDARQWTSRRHARLVRSGAVWTISDLDSKNGLWLDDERRPSFVLAPGIEVGIGSLRLIAESQRLVTLRALMARLIGWDDASAEAIDRALRSVRTLAARSTPLHLRGDGDLVPVARALHLRTFGERHPFIVNDPQRPPSAADARSAGNVIDLAAAVRAAAGGTLCVRAERSVLGLAEVRRRVSERGKLVRLVICAQRERRVEDHGDSVITLTPLSERAKEIKRMIDEYAAEALTMIGAARETFTPQDASWVQRRNPQSHSEIQIAVTRIAAIRHFGGVTRAAAYLGISHVALSRWRSRRR
jgi:hypothetical protein